MIENATLTAWKPRVGTSADGVKRFGTETPYGVRCMVDGITNKQRFNLGASLKDSTSVAYVQLATIPHPPKNGDILTFQIDEVETLLIGEVITTAMYVLASLSHVEVFFK